MPVNDRNATPRYFALRQWFSAAVVAIGLSVLFGWLADIDWLKSLLPGLTSMKANTALGITAGGLAVLLMRPRADPNGLAAMAAALMLIVGMASLLEYLLGQSFGIDELLARDTNPLSLPVPGRMSFATASAFVLLGLSLCMLSLARRAEVVRSAHLLAAATGAIAILALAGYAYGVQALSGFAPFVTVALHTGIALLLLAVAALMIRTDEGWERPFLARPIARHALIRVGAVSVFIPLIAGLLAVLGIRFRLYQAAFSPALFAVATACALLWLAFRSSLFLASAEEELQAAREEARTSEERLRLALSSGRGIGTWDWDVINDRVVVDERFAVLYGVEPALARSGAPIARFFSGIHPDDLPRVREAVAAALRTGQPFAEEYRLLRPGTGPQWVMAEGRCALAADGTPQRFPGVSFDITDRKIVESHQAALLSLSDRVRDLVDPELIAYEACKILGETLEVSRIGYGLVNMTDETITIDRDWNAPGVKSLAGVLHFRDYGSYIEDLKRGETVIFADARLDPRTAANASALEGISARSVVNMPLVEQGGLVALLYANHAKDRTWSETDLQLMRQTADRVRAATERARAEAAVRQSEEQFRVFAQTVPDHIWASRPDGYLDWFNDQFYEFSGVLPGSVDGDTAWSQLVHPDDLQTMRQTWATALSSGAVYEAEFRIRRGDGEYRWFLVRAEPVKSGGEIVRWVGTNTDIDERRGQAAELARLNAHLEAEVATRTQALMVSEEQLRQSQKMEAVGQLTGGIAHDFNNLLTGISGSLELLQSRIAQGRMHDLERYILAAQGASKRAAALTHRLLAFARRQTLDPKPTNANRLIAGMEDLIRRTVGPGVRLEVVEAGGLWLTLADPHQLENALLNLCINSRDAMPKGGRITIETSNKWLDEKAAGMRELPAGQYIAVCVSDTGTGMAPDIIAKAFDPFFTTKPMGEGTGLGLSMVYGFVRQSGGQVRIYSEVGQGTMVCLYLPRFRGTSEGAEDPAVAADMARAATGETVLVVDDEPTVRMLVTDVLEDLGYAAMEAADAIAGLKILESSARIDLLISDVGLPGGMNGRQMADAARLVRPDLKVLFITGYAENAVVGNGHLEHDMHVMTKPFGMDAMANRIRDLIVSK